MKAKAENVQESRPDVLAGFAFRTPQRAELVLSDVDEESRAELDRLVQLNLVVKEGSVYRIKLRRKTIFD
jgi:hypothetical protein